MNILITGIHGFVGSNLVKAIAPKQTIYGLDIVQPTKEGVKTTFTWEALEVKDGMPQVDAIIHLAGKVHDTRNKSAADVYFKSEYRADQEDFRLVSGKRDRKEVYLFLYRKGSC